MITVEEMKNFLRTLNRAYPSTWKSFTSEDLKGVLDLWMRVLKDYTYEQVDSAILAYMKQRHEFPPTTGHIVDLITQQSLIPKEVHAINHKSSEYERGKYLRNFLREVRKEF